MVDACQGVEAQTLANVYQAIDAHHEIVPVLNKIDLPAADVPRVKQQIEDVIGIDASEAVEISAKTGLNIEGVLDALVTRLPPPKGDAQAPLSALLIDSWYDQYLGVVILVRVKNGVLQARPEDPHDGHRRGAPDRAARRLHAENARRGEPRAGRDGLSSPPPSKPWRIARSATPSPMTAHPAPSPCPASNPPFPWCGAGCTRSMPTISRNCATASAKLRLNDASFHYEPETSAALGFGFRCGFLGLLHLEIIQERLTREFDLDLIATAPSVVYHIHLTNGEMSELHNPVDMPDGR